MEIVQFLVANFKSGGIFMYGILAVLVVGTAIIVDRVLALLIRGRINADAFWREIDDLLQHGKMADAQNHADRSAAPLARVLAAGLAAAQRGEAREGIDRRIEEAVRSALPHLEKRIHYLYTLS